MNSPTTTTATTTNSQPNHHTTDASDTPHSTLEVRNPFTEYELQPPPEVHAVHVAPEVVRDVEPDAARDRDAEKHQKEVAPALVTVPILGKVRRRVLHIAIFVAALSIVAIGLGLGVSLSQKHSGDGTDSPEDTGTENETVNPLAVRKDTRITAANFTDGLGNTNALVFYQLQNNAIYMSAFNSSVDEWIVSPVIDGKGNVTLDEVRPGTALAVDVFFHNSSSRYVHLYYQDPDNIIRVIFRYAISTHEASTVSDWIYETSEVSVASNGSAITSYAKQTQDSFLTSCLFSQTESGGVRGSFLQGGNDQGYSSMLFPKASKPSDGTNMTIVGVPSVNETSRSLSVFYHGTSGVLSQLLYNDGGTYSSEALPRGLGENSAIAAFATGYNGTDGADVGFQVLTMDPDTDDGVLLTYYHDGQWTAGDEVTALSDCASRATMVATADGRVYCVVDGKNGTEIVQWKWTGDAEASTDSFTRYKRLSTVDTDVS